MSTRLPQEVQTQKVKTLPDDLKKLAEELLGAKFGEEVVEVESHDPFQGLDGFGAATHVRPHDVFIDPDVQYRRRFDERQRGYKDEIRLEIRPWDRSRHAELRIRTPSPRSLMEAIRRFDNENIRSERTFIMNPTFFDYLLREDRGQYISKSHYRDRDYREGERRHDAEIFGCKIILHPGMSDCVIEANF